MNQLLSIIELSGAIPGIFFGLLKLFMPKEDTPNRILGAALFFYALLLLIIYLGRAGFLTYNSDIILISNTSISISWPLFFLYISLITGSISQLKARDILHTIPFLVYFFSFLLPLIKMNSLPRLFYILSFIYAFIVSVTYSVSMLIKISIYNKQVDDYYAESHNVKMTWLSTTVIIWLAITCLQLLFVPIQKTITEQFPLILQIHGIILNFASISWIYLFAYFAITHPHIFKQSQKIIQTLTPDDDLQNYQAQEEKQSQPIVNDEYAEVIEKRLERIMQEKKPYLNDQLTLPALAEMITVPPYLLGRFINSRMNKNFMTYINEYRVEVVKQKLLDPCQKDLTILEIAYQSGFKTKSAFNNFFKNYTGQTPSQYKKANS